MESEQKEQLTDKGETAITNDLDTEHQQALEAAAAQVASVGRLFFKMVVQQVRNVETLEDLRELGESQIWVLHSLMKGKHMTTELAKRYNVTNPTMTRIIDSLVQKGFVERHYEERDRRCIFLQLTQEGMDKSKHMEDAFRNALIKSLRPLSREQLEDIVRAYSHLAALLPDRSQEITDETLKKAEKRRSMRDRTAHKKARMERKAHRFSRYTIHQMEDK